MKEETTIKIALCATTALLMCFLGEFPNAAVGAAATFAGDIAVMTMFTLYFAMIKNELSENYPESRAKIRCAAESVELTLKIAFTALCALSGSVMIHAAALIANVIFSKVRVFFTRDPHTAHGVDDRDNGHSNVRENGKPHIANAERREN